MIKYFKNFFVDRRKVIDPRYGCIMTNGFDEAFGRFARLAECFMMFCLIFCGITAIIKIILTGKLLF